MVEEHEYVVGEYGCVEIGYGTYWIVIDISECD
jgi:hypothetical protein